MRSLSDVLQSFIAITHKEVKNSQAADEAIDHVKWLLASTLEVSEVRACGRLLSGVTGSVLKSRVRLSFVDRDPGEQGGIQFAIPPRATGYDFLLIGGRGRVPKIEASREANALIRRRRPELDDLRQQLGRFLVAEPKTTSLVRVQFSPLRDDAERDRLQSGILRLIELASH